MSLILNNTYVASKGALYRLGDTVGRFLSQVSRKQHALYFRAAASLAASFACVRSSWLCGHAD